jgi:hypothetical protein
VSTYRWQLPAPPAAAPLGSVGASAATLPSELAGRLDLAFDPLTHDLIDLDSGPDAGQWVETTDSRTAVIFQMESEAGAWWADPEQGSRIRALISGEEPATIQDLVDEVKRCLQLLVDDGLIHDLSVSLTQEKDEADRVVIVLMYTDLSSGNLIDLAFVPFAT